MNVSNSRKRIAWASPVLGGREYEYVMDALRSSWISEGPYVERLEQGVCDRIGCAHAVAVSSGTAALHLALLALGIGPGDEVVVPGLTFAATANAVIHVGAKPVFADVDPRTWCLDVKRLPRYISRRTKAVIAVHLYGNICDMDEVKHIASQHGIAIIEDAAEAIFSKYKGQYAGCSGDLGCYSFHAAKTITTGEGGMVVTSSQFLADRVRMLRNHGMNPSRRYWHEFAGLNYRLTDLQAAVGCAQLEGVEDAIRRRRELRALYEEELGKIPGVHLQQLTDGVEPVYWGMHVRIDPAHFRNGRDRVIQQMEDAGIEVRPGFYPFSKMPAYQSAPLPVAEEIGQQTICLPFHVLLGPSEVSYICGHLMSLAGK